MGTVLIKNGMVFDGTGTASEQFDIFAEDGVIREIGFHIEKDADLVIYADGMAVTPGFIDIHRHCDKAPFDFAEKGNDYGKAILRQGITTVVTGNCGISMYPVNPDPAIRQEMQRYYEPVLGNCSDYAKVKDYESYIKKLSDIELPVNTAAMIGMGAIRVAVRGFSEGRYSEKEIRQCQIIVENALKTGAPGVSIGLMYLPEVYETAEELGEILKPLGKYDRILTAHIRGEGDSLVKSVEEVIAIAKLAGCRLEISHFKSCGKENWKKEIFQAAELIDDARREGMKVTCDFYPYNCGSTTLMSLIPPAFIAGNLTEALRCMATKEGREKLRKMLQNTYEDWDNYVISLGWDKAVISSVSHQENQWKIGKNLCEITKEGGYLDEVEAAADLLVSEDGNVAMVIQSMYQSDIDFIARLPYSCVISDAIYAETDRPHPRMYGAFPEFFHNYVIERHVLKAGEAIAKMTGIPAERMKLEGRGYIKEGYACDINIFELKEFQSRATYVNPTQYAEGLRYCLVNGVVAVKNDIVVNQVAGRKL